MSKYSDIALKTLAIKASEKLTNKQFYDTYTEPGVIHEKYNDILTDKITKEIIAELDRFGVDGFICNNDKEFPIINTKSSVGDKPYLLFYKGNLQLLKSLNDNVAVIGLREPSNKTKYREEKIVESLIKKKFNIVSGLALGCDTVAHQYTLKNGGKTIAILPSSIQNILPNENRDLAEKIVQNDGLLITEYFGEARDRYETVKRYIDRDRLQAMFSKTVILIASNEKGKGDSGSKHAMDKAKKYGLQRYVMYDERTDADNLEFALNKIYHEKEGVKVFKPSSIKEIYEYCIASLDNCSDGDKQLKLDF